MHSGTENLSMLKKSGIWASRTIRIIAIIVAAAVFIGLGLYWVRTHNSNITRLDASVDAPIAAHFADDKSTIFMNDAPDVNNNRDIVPPAPLNISYNYVSGPGAPAFIQRVQLSAL